MRQANAPCNAQHAELRLLSEHWGRGLLSTDEAMGWLLVYLARPSDDEAARTPELNTQHSELKTPSLVLGTLLRQLSDAVDALAGPQLDVWQAGGLWYWRWEDTSSLASHGLASLGEALTDAVERRHPNVFPPPNAGI